jgi:hypothetical protein
MVLMIAGFPIPTALLNSNVPTQQSCLISTLIQLLLPIVTAVAVQQLWGLSWLSFHHF